MAQSGSYNDHRMLKNAPNELKFGPDMYFYEFYQIIKAIFGQKMPYLG